MKSKIEGMKKMAKLGHGNEQQFAIDWLKKHNINTEEQNETYLTLKYNTKFEKVIVFQCVMDVLKWPKDLTYIQHKKSVSIRTPCELQQKIISKIQITLEDYRKDLLLFNDAFLYKNKLYCPEHKTNKNKNIDNLYDDDDIDKILGFARNVTHTILEDLLEK